MVHEMFALRQSYCLDRCEQVERTKKVKVLEKPVIESLSKLERDVQMLRFPSSFHSVDSSIASNISSLEASLAALLTSGASWPSRGSVRSFLEPEKVTFSEFKRVKVCTVRPREIVTGGDSLFVS